MVLAESKSRRKYQWRGGLVGVSTHRVPVKVLTLQKCQESRWARSLQYNDIICVGTSLVKSGVDENFSSIQFCCELFVVLLSLKLLLFRGLYTVSTSCYHDGGT